MLKRIPCIVVLTICLDAMAAVAQPSLQVKWVDDSLQRLTTRGRLYEAADTMLVLFLDTLPEGAYPLFGIPARRISNITVCKPAGFSRQMMTGAMVGFALGAAAGAGTAVSIEDDIHGKQVNIPLCAIVGGILGMSVCGYFAASSFLEFNTGMSPSRYASIREELFPFSMKRPGSSHTQENKK